ncbi:unnamed protein product [Effrenium voratum]|uniref:Uncharacterized protein n=1 Tax=Effrenium voratum TaxID=2562239 RepID=A0AA36IUZ9_9DINO|nr:unnamed protein product [Effrenium voratum]
MEPMGPTRFKTSSIALEDVRLIVPVAPPDCAGSWPVTVLNESDCPDAVGHVYLCGTIEDVQRQAQRFPDALGCFSDTRVEGVPSCEVLPQLRHGFNAHSWEALLRATCSRHVATIQEKILRHARRRPDKVALVFEDRHWTYQQLCSAACSLRDCLVDAGLRPEKGAIGVRMDASDYSAICHLAVLAGGFAIHILDRGGHGRVSTCATQALITMRGEGLELEDLRVFYLDEIALDSAAPVSSLHVSGDVNDIAFIEYTSGTSGRPKAVATTQWRISHWSCWHQFHFPPGESRDAYNLFWIWYWHIPLTTGSTCVVWPNWQSRDVAKLMKYFEKHRVTRVNCLTPGQISALLAVQETLPKDLQVVFSGGEALPLETCRRWRKKWPQVRLICNYASTECAADVAFAEITEEIASLDMPYAPISSSSNIICWNNELLIQDQELVVTGWNVCSGYLPPTESTSFSPCEDGISNSYRTGDTAEMQNGNVFIMGRKDSGAKIRGFRVDLSGLEALLGRCPAVRASCPMKFNEGLYVVCATDDLDLVKAFAKENYQHAQLIVWVQVQSLPFTKSGKADKKAILTTLEDLQKGPEVEEAFEDDTERRVANAYKEVMGWQIGRDVPFAEAGGHSLFAMRIAKLLDISPADLFKYPSISSLASFLKASAGDTSPALPMELPAPQFQFPAEPLAVLGLACRLPGAASVANFWQALQAGALLTTELRVAPGQIPRKGVVPDLGFDCHFWKCSEQTAALMDTTQRSLLEVTYEAFVGAGLHPHGSRMSVVDAPLRDTAVFVSGGSLSHWPEKLGMDLEESRTLRPDEYFNLEVATDKDYLATSIAYRFDFHGPAEVVQTACSSALVAMSRAVHLLQMGGCGYAVCGGASFSPDAPIAVVNGMIWSPDGVTRPYSEDANGTTNSDGAGVVLLARATNAAQHASHGKILGSATNNDGRRKANFSAPSLEGQVEVVFQALANAGIEGSQLQYVEGHGTGTPLGDPLEVSALTHALGKDGRIHLGSVKGNVGHLNTAAGVPGVLKALLVLKHQTMVPSLHAVRPSTAVDWTRTSLSLAAISEPWKGRFGGVSSFGIGGTNAHVVLEAESGNGLNMREVTWSRSALEAYWPGAAGKVRRVAKPKVEAAEKPKTLEDWFYEACREKAQVSLLQPKMVALLWDGEDEGGPLPQGMPETVLTTWPRALHAARAAGGFLIFLGTSTKEPDVDDESQAELLLNCAVMIKKLAQESKGSLEVAFVLQDTLRYAALVGFLRTALHEHPEIRLRLLLLEGRSSVRLPAQAGEFILTTEGIFEPRLRAVPAPKVASPSRFRRALVTGGLRGLGLRVAKWLAETGRAESLVLMGRHRPEGPNAELLQLLSKQLPTEVCLANVASWKEVQTLPSDCDLVVHCAGTVKDGLLLSLTEDAVTKVLDPKIRGALHLRKKYPHATKVAFSSSSGLFGVPGQSTYAAGNTFVDAVMPSVQWGGWGETGMATDLGIKPQPGENFMSVADGLECFGRILDGALDRKIPYAILDVHWPVFRRQTAVFQADEPLLATIEQALSLAPASLDQRQAWTMLVGPAGCRHQGSLPRLELCQQHWVSGTVVMPGSAFLAISLEAVAQVKSTEMVTLEDIKFTLPLELKTARLLTLTITRAESGGALRFSSRALGAEAQEEVVHCTCSFRAEPWELTQSSLEAPETSPVPDIYDQFAAAGYVYGPDFQGRNFGVQGDFACCELPKAMRGFALDPADLDVAMQLSSLVHPLGMRGAPHQIREVTAKVGSQLAKSHARYTGAESADVHMFNDKGEVVCRVAGLTLASTHAEAHLKSCRTRWEEIAPVPRSCWRVVGEEVKKLCLDDVTESHQEFYEAVAYAVSARTMEDVKRCQTEVRKLVARCRCWLLCVEGEGCRFAEAAAEAALEVGAMAVIGSREQLKAAARDLGMDSKSVLRIIEENGVARLKQRVTQEEQQAPELRALRTEPYIVEIHTSLWALNFRDVLVALGAIPDTVAGTSLGLGGETYGTVTALGEGVSHLAVGDSVIAIPPDGMGSYLVTDARMVARAPQGMTPEEAVSGTCVYATAWLALHWCGRIQPGERVLIHSAAGGVGLAAVHLCKKVGCEIYATASTEEKKRLLESLGATAFNSRKPKEFEDGILEATKGEGVDVVLNSLSGEAILASFRLLREFGRFLEIGKRDQYENTQLGLGQFLKGISFSAAHFDVLMLKRPEKCAKLLQEVWAEMPGLPRLPSRTFPMSDLQGALNFFAKGVHIGKILVSVEDVAVQPARPSRILRPPADFASQALKAKYGMDEGAGGVHCVPQLADASEELLAPNARMVLTASGAVATMARELCPEATCVWLPRWEPVNSLDEWLKLGGFIRASEEEPIGDLSGWLLSIVEEMAGPIEMDTTFEDAGLDSLSLISLARRLSSNVSKVISVADLMDNPTPRRLLQALSGGPQSQLSRPKAVCLHGFRSNKDALAAQLGPLISAIGGVEWLFVDSPRRATGLAAEHIDAHDAREWWGSGDFETGWQTNYEALSATLPSVRQIGAVGAVGFSQGGGVAALLDCAWKVLLSPVKAPGLQRRSDSCLLAYDPAEEHVEECKHVGEFFTRRQLHAHDAGHGVPRDAHFAKVFRDFVSQQL